MKIFINNFNLDALPNVLTGFNDSLVKTEVYIQVYSIDGIYKIDPSKILKLTAVDSDIEILKDYCSPFTLIVDKKRTSAANGLNAYGQMVSNVLYA